MPNRLPLFVRLPVHLAALAPILWLVANFAADTLGVNPVQAAILFLGRTTLVLLLAALAVTPVRVISGYSPALRLRRTLGLYAAAYADLHLLSVVGLDYGFNLSFLFADLGEKPYIFAGLGALLCLLPAAITSTQGWQRRLGNNWRRLHRLVYAAGVFAVIHYYWQVKAGHNLAIAVAVFLALLLALRLPQVRRLFGGRAPAPDSR